MRSLKISAFFPQEWPQSALNSVEVKRSVYSWHVCHWRNCDSKEIYLDLLIEPVTRRFSEAFSVGSVGNNRCVFTGIRLFLSAQIVVSVEQNKTYNFV